MNTEEDKIKEFFKTLLKNSGYSLENDVETKLEKRFTVERGKSYLDKDEGKGREIDIIAYSFFPETDKITKNKKMVLGELFLIIECKNLPDNGWIFFENDKKDDFLIPEIFTYIRTNRREEIIKKCIPYGPVSGLSFVSGYKEAVLNNKKHKDQSKPQSNFKDSNLYQAILTTIKATRHQIDRREEILVIFRYFIYKKDFLSIFIFNYLYLYIKWHLSNVKSAI